MQARPAELEPERQPSGVDSDHDADALHAPTGAEVSDTQPSDVAQPPSALVSLEQPAQVAGENGDGMLHVQSDVSAPVAAQEVPTLNLVCFIADLVVDAPSSF